MAENYLSYYKNRCNALENMDLEWAKGYMAGGFAKIIPGVGTTNYQYVTRELKPFLIDVENDLSKEEQALKEFVRSHADVIQHQIKQASNADKKLWQEIQQEKNIAQNLALIASNSNGKIPACNGLIDRNEWRDKEISPNGYHKEKLVYFTRETYHKIYQTAQAKYAYQTLMDIKSGYEQDKKEGKISEISANYALLEIKPNQYVEKYKEANRVLSDLDDKYTNGNLVTRGLSRVAFEWGTTNAEYVDEHLRPHVKRLQGQAEADKEAVIKFIENNPEVIQYKIDNSNGTEKKSWETIQATVNGKVQNDQKKQPKPDIANAVFDEISKLKPLDSNIRDRSERHKSTFTAADHDGKIVKWTRMGHKAIYDSARFQHTYNVLAQARNEYIKSEKKTEEIKAVPFDSEKHFKNLNLGANSSLLKEQLASQENNSSVSEILSQNAENVDKNTNPTNTYSMNVRA